MIYLDYCATTPMDPRVSELMDSLEREVYGNPSSVHQLGQEAKARVEIARRQVASAIGAAPSEIVFTGSGSEANNIALWDVVHGSDRHVIFSAVEHPSISHTASALQAWGVEITEIGVDHTGIIDPADVADAIRPDTTLVTIMTANNETGTIQPIEEVAAICRDREVRFHTDAVQALGKIEVDCRAMAIDTASFAAHKIYGPKGVGALYVRKGVKLHPHVYGGSQEQTLRAGTENVAGIAGFGLAAEIATTGVRKEAVRLESLRGMIVEYVSRELPSASIHGHSENHLPGVLNIGFPSVDGQTLLMNLDLDGFAISTGSACSSGSPKPSQTLKAMGLSDDECRSALRVSLGRFTQESDVKSFIDALSTHVRQLKGSYTVAATA